MCRTIQLSTTVKSVYAQDANPASKHKRCSPGGIGHALAREFHSRGTALPTSKHPPYIPSWSFRPDSDGKFVTGLRVFATARSRDSVADLNDLGIETLTLEVDKPDSITRCREDIEVRTGGGLDFLVNNAGRSTSATRG